MFKKLKMVAFLTVFLICGCSQPAKEYPYPIIVQLLEAGDYYRLVVATAFPFKTTVKIENTTDLVNQLCEMYSCDDTILVDDVNYKFHEYGYPCTISEDRPIAISHEHYDELVKKIESFVFIIDVLDEKENVTTTYKSKAEFRVEDTE